jgi:hypothetical protein
MVLSIAGPRRWYTPIAIMGSNPTGDVDFFCVLCCQVEVSVTSVSLIQRSPTDCGASLCVIKKPHERGGHSPRWAAEPEKIIIIIFFLSIEERVLFLNTSFGKAIDTQI